MLIALLIAYLANNLNPRPKWRRPILLTAAAHKGLRAALARYLSKLLDQSALADTRFANDRCKTRTRRIRGIQKRTK